jgi:MarR family transcriptional regulator for hemolysin
MPSEIVRERIGRLIQHVSRNWRRALNLSLAPVGLTDATWLPLLYLNRVGPVRQVDLADYLGLDRSSVVRLVDTLTAQGLVRREDDPQDRRVRWIVLTDAAAEVVRAAQLAAAEVRGQALAGIDPEDLATTERVLGIILSRLPQPHETLPAESMPA